MKELFIVSIGKGQYIPVLCKEGEALAQAQRIAKALKALKTNRRYRFSTGDDY